MKLDHINLTVRDVAEASNFLKRHFGYRDLFEDDDAGMVALEDGSGLAVLLMRGAQASYPKMFHVGFGVETQDRVAAVHRALVAAPIVAPRARRALRRLRAGVERAGGGDSGRGGPRRLAGRLRAGRRGGRRARPSGSVDRLRSIGRPAGDQQATKRSTGGPAVAPRPPVA